MSDARDSLWEGAAALRGLTTLVTSLPEGEDVPAGQLGAILRVIDERVFPAAEELAFAPAK